jgi:hypothetical protein
MKYVPLLALAVCICLGAVLFTPRMVIVPSSAFAPEVFARIRLAPLSELSGLVLSKRQQGVMWAHNDSGDKSRLFALNLHGESILPTYSALSQFGDVRVTGKTQWQGFEVLGAEHVDWEDIAVDERYLYIADMGNNRNRRTDLAIYAVSEIDPTASTRTAVLQKYPVVYPDQHRFPDPSWDFDSESLFVADEALYIITKHRTETFPRRMQRGAKLYRLDTRHTDRENVLTLVDSHPDMRAASGADLSPDGQTLAVITYSALWLFDRPEGNDAWLNAPSRRIPLVPRVVKQVESVTWVEDDTLLIGNEQRDLFRINLNELTMQ